MEMIHRFLKRYIATGALALLVLLFPSTAFAATNAASSSTTDTATTSTDDSTPPPDSSSSDSDTSTSSKPAATQDTSSTTQDTSSTSASAATAGKPGKPDIPSKPATGPAKPTGADSNTYHYDAASGLWENDYYTWDPVTKQTAPKTPQTYSYNPSTGMWDTTKYQYDASADKYVPNTISTATKPATASATPAANTSGNVGTTGPNSTNKSTDTSTSSDAFAGFYNANISNQLGSQATSGDAISTTNTSAGDVTSGNALAMTNVLNLLQSSTSFAGSGSPLLTFVKNIQGDVTGDLLIDPSMLGQLQSAQNAQAPPTNLTVTTKQSGQIDNDIAVDSQSGNAKLASNTTAGNATSGAADAVANVVNLINTAIGASQSFMGTINIYGDLNGDILMPQKFLSALIASNTPTTSINTSQIKNSQLKAQLTNNDTINNQVTATAASGAATAAQNTTAGNITTGDANTNLTVFNLTGHQVVGDNALLVFVNVLGKWVGVIMDAPSGSTAAALGGGLTQNAVMPLAQRTDINTASNNQINNDISVNAKSGNATLTQNTQAGNATSGDATASANILNIINNQMSLGKWFGILFINVFGSWNGSFGVNTAAGTLPSQQSTSGDGNSDMNTNSVQNGTPAMRVFHFVPGGSNTGSASTHSFYTAPMQQASVGGSSNGGTGVTYTTYTELIPYTHLVTTPGHTTIKANPEGAHHDMFMPVAGTLLGTAMLGIDQRKRFTQWRHKLTQK